MSMLKIRTKTMNSLIRTRTMNSLKKKYISKSVILKKRRKKEESSNILFILSKGPTKKAISGSTEDILNSLH